MINALFKEVFKDAIPIFEEVAPTFARILASNNYTAIALALSVLAKAFNASSSDLPSLAKEILNDPEAQILLKNLEMKHGAWLELVFTTLKELI